MVVGLELDRAAGRNRQRAIPVVLEDGVVHDELVVQVDRGAGTDLDDPEGVPLADGLVGHDQRVFARCAGAVVPQAARAFVGPHASIAGLAEVPDLDLRRAAEVNAAISLGTDLEVDQELDVAVVFVGGEIGSLAVVDDHAVVDAPVFLHVLRAVGECLGLLVGPQCLELAGVHGLQPVPAGEVLAVEQRDEALGERCRLHLLRRSTGSRGHDHARDQNDRKSLVHHLNLSQRDQWSERALGRCGDAAPIIGGLGSEINSLEAE